MSRSTPWLRLCGLLAFTLLAPALAPAPARAMVIIGPPLVMPTSTLPDGTFIFNNVSSGQWFDPPSVDGFDFLMLDGALFTEIVDFPTGFAAPFEVWVGSTFLGNYASGESASFAGFVGGGVSQFSVRGINPLVDAGDPTAFPIQLAFNKSTASFSMTPVSSVPEPSSIALAALGLATLGLARRWTTRARS